LKGIRILFLLLGGLLLQIAVAQAAELKIGFVNAAQILDKAPQAELARSRLEKEFAPRDKSLVDAQKSLRSLEEKLARDSAVMGDSERRNLERDIIAQQRELKRAQDEFREDFNIRRNEELGSLQRQVYEAIVSLAKEEQFDLIVNDGAVIYASEQVDITDQVLRRLTK
jgi:outer membrane protein